MIFFVLRVTNIWTFVILKLLLKSNYFFVSQFFGDVTWWHHGMETLSELSSTCACWGSLAALEWRHNGLNSVSNHQPHHCLLNRLFRRRSKKTSKLRVTGLCEGNSPGTGEFPAQMASNAENVSIWWRHHGNPVMLSIDDLFDVSLNKLPEQVSLNKLFNKQSSCWWFETPWRTCHLGVIDNYL